MLETSKEQKGMIVHYPHSFEVLFFFVLQIVETGEKIGLKHFKPVKPLGCGDTGRYNSSTIFYMGF
jgi:hypothetical protein